MLKFIFIRLLVLVAFLFSFEHVQAQCKAQEKGKNLVQNSGFELGDTLFTAGTYFSWNKNGLQGWSSAGQYWVGDSPTRFNHQGFEQAALAHKGNKMMLVDADCDAGKTVWEQVVYVYPNTNYYFSLWIQSLKDISPAKLSFEVDGVTLGKLVDAPATPGVWQFYEDVWNSGSLEGEVHLIIKERSGVNCGSGDDFAIDDISFIPGCEFGAPGPIVDLGEDVSICGSGGQLTLNSGIAAQNNVTFLWNTGETTPSISITAPGIYYVCVDSVSACPRSDVIEVLNDYTIGLQSDVDLCNPATVTLDPGYSAIGVTYKWYKNNQVLSGKTDQQLLVNAPGTYVVQVNEPICGVRSDTIEVTSSAAKAGNDDFCLPGMPSLSIDGPGNYVWYDSPDLTNEVAAGATFDPTGLTQTTTYYVKDTSSFVKHIGEPTKLSSNYGTDGNDPNDAYSKGFQISVISDLILDSVSVYPYSWGTGTGNVGITVYDVTDGGKVLVEQVVRQISLPNNGGNPTEADKRQVYVGINLIGGKEYVITNEVPVGTQDRVSAAFHDNGTIPTYPYSIPGFISINKLVNQYNSSLYGVFYDWVITVGSPCKPVQVIATAYCPPTCTDITFVNLLGTSDLCGGTGELSVIVSPAENYEFEFFYNESRVQKGASTTYTASQAGTYKVLVTDPRDPDVCFIESDLLQVSSSNPGKPTIVGDLKTCAGDQSYFSVLNNVSGVYTWEVIGDGASIISPSDTGRVFVQLGDSAVQIIVTPINALCGNGEPDTLIVNEFGPHLVDVDPIPKYSIIDLGNSANIGAEVIGDGSFQYRWLNQDSTFLSDNDFVQVAPLLKDGGTVSYYIQVTDIHGCIDIDTAYVNIVKVPLFIPNLITPNNDNKNDYFAITGITPGTKVSIYNRWGQVVYTSDNYDNLWKAENVTDGVYYVQIELGITNEIYKSWLEVLSNKN